MIPIGTEVELLHCPTCREPYAQPLRIHQREDDDALIQCVNPRRAVELSARRQMYVVCPSGHEWSVKAAAGKVVDGWPVVLYVQLDRLVGGRP